MRISLTLMYLAAASSALAAPPKALDAIDLASATSRLSHGVHVSGGAVIHGAATVGALRLPVAGARLRPGGRLQAHIGGSGAPSSIQVTLATDPGDYGKAQTYRVLVDGHETYRAHEADRGGGVTRSIFLDVPHASQIAIICDPHSAAPLIVSRIRVYAGQSGAWRSASPRMGLALLTRQSYGYSIDDAEMRDLIARVPKSSHLIPQTAVLFNFCNRTLAENARDMRRLTRQAERLGIPLRIACQVQWGGVPARMPDGLGGHLGDLPYQQIVWDEADHVHDPGLKGFLGAEYDVRYGLSVPNAFGNTPWLTFNNPRLNSLRDARLVQTLRVWRAERDRLGRAGRQDLAPIELGTGEETIYWAKGMPDDPYTKANGGIPRENMMGDFNPSTVAAARRDGVTLNPRDGLDAKERWWLHQNLARQQQRLIDAMLLANPPEPTRIRRGGALYAEDLVRRNLFTEPYAMTYFPMKEISAFHPQMEAGFVHEGRAGGEWWSGAAMLPWLMKQRERGRTAAPNVECTGVGSEGLVGSLEAAYAMGERYVTLYNWKWHAAIDDILKSFAQAIDAPDGIGFPPARATETLRPGAPLSRTVRPGPRAFGWNVARVYAAGRARGRVRFTLTNGHGDSASITQPAGSGVFRFPALFPVEPGQPCTVSLEALDCPVEVALAEDGSLAARLQADIAAERARSVAIGDWQDAEDLLQSIAQKQAGRRDPEERAALRQARTLLEAGQPRDAYRAGIRAEQVTLPAAFDLGSPGGRLGPYPIWVTCRQPMAVTVTQWTGETGAVLISSSANQTVTVKTSATSCVLKVIAGREARVQVLAPPPPGQAAGGR
ncbi:MAG TPA: hypothetical protein VGM37_05305 [Armatimonadota bacterium]|jgi:hypothetical protein